MLRIIRWSEIERTDRIPPFGDALRRHLENSKPKSDSYAAWNLLYKTLLDHGLEPEEVVFTSTGKPFFRDVSVFFSLSHSENLCAVSVSDVPTGIDVEKSDRNVSDRVLKRVLSPEEYGLYKDDPIVAWCKKETSSKISGRGMVEESGVFTIDTDKIDFEIIDVNAGGINYKIVSGFMRKDLSAMG